MMLEVSDLHAFYGKSHSQTAHFGHRRIYRS